MSRALNRFLLLILFAWALGGFGYGTFSGRIGAEASGPAAVMWAIFAVGAGLTGLALLLAALGIATLHFDDFRAELSRVVSRTPRIRELNAGNVDPGTWSRSAQRSMVRAILCAVLAGYLNFEAGAAGDGLGKAYYWTGALIVLVLGMDYLAASVVRFQESRVLSREQARRMSIK